MVGPAFKDIAKRLDEIIEHVQQQRGTLRLPFEHRNLRILWATRLMYDHQLQMHHANTNRIVNRIVSIYQSYVRPTMRGKAKHKVEFGSKNGISLQPWICAVREVKLGCLQ